MTNLTGTLTIEKASAFIQDINEVFRKYATTGTRRAAGKKPATNGAAKEITPVATATKKPAAKTKGKSRAKSAAANKAAVIQ